MVGKVYVDKKTVDILEANTRSVDQKLDIQIRFESQTWRDAYMCEISFKHGIKLTVR